MTWLFILAGTMAIFGVIGYLRGWRAALFILIMTILAIAVTGALAIRSSSTSTRSPRAFNSCFREG